MAKAETINRQWLAIKVLQLNPRGLTLEALAAKIGCSPRHAHRDLQVLRELGLPVEHEELRFGKRLWRLNCQAPEHADLPFSFTELVSLFLSRQLFAPFAGTSIGDGLDSVIRKIRALLPETALDYFCNLNQTLLVKLAVRHDYSGQDAELRLLNRAIDKCRVVKVVYHAPSEKREFESEFHPYGLILLGASLYVVGHLSEHGEIRTLKVDRIRQLQATARSFQRPADFSLRDHVAGSFGVFAQSKPQTVQARFTDWAARSVREQEWHPSQKIVEGSDDHVVVQFELSSTLELKRWLLGFGGNAVVLKPQDLAAEILAEAAAIQAAYPR